jgi:hypothetical protein
MHRVMSWRIRQPGSGGTHGLSEYVGPRYRPALPCLPFDAHLRHDSRSER